MTPGQFLELFASLTLQAALVVIATHWLCRLVECERAASRLWQGCQLALLLLVLAGSLLPHPRAFHPWSGLENGTAAEMAEVQADLGKVVFAIWLCGALGAAVLFAVRLFATHRFLQLCEPADGELAALGEFVSEFDTWNGAPGKVALLQSRFLSSPFCWQFHRPFIVLPKSLAGLDSKELRLIVRHELEHLKTGHPLHVFLQRAVEAVFWFHPMVWWASHQADLTREFACDDAAVSSRNDVADYLRALLKIVELNAVADSRHSATLAFGRGKRSVAARAWRLVQRVQETGVGRRGKLPASAARAGLITAAMVIALVWLPINVLASSRSTWSPWPKWSAVVLHDFGIPLRDFEMYDWRSQPHELLEKKEAALP